jgi:hypothetical protein
MQNIQQLDSLSGKQFENLIGQLLRKLRFRIEYQSTGPDGGIDILASSEADLVSGCYIIQCKCYSKKVGVAAVRDLVGVVSDQRANKGILITNAEFTKPALDFAKGNPIELIDGNSLSTLLEKHLGQMLKSREEGVLLPPSMIRVAKLFQSNHQSLKELIDDQQEKLTKNLMIIKPKKFSNLSDETSYFGQNNEEFGNAMDVLNNQVGLLNGRMDEVEPHRIKRNFSLVRSTVKELLKLQMDIHRACLLEPSEVPNVYPNIDPRRRRIFESEAQAIQDLYSQYKKVYATLFRTLSTAWGKGLEEVGTFLEFPEKITRGLKKNRQENIVFPFSIDLGEMNVEITKGTKITKRLKLLFDELNILSGSPQDIPEKEMLKAAGNGCLLSIVEVIFLLALIVLVLYYVI